MQRHPSHRFLIVACVLTGVGLAPVIVYFVGSMKHSRTVGRAPGERLSLTRPGPRQGPRAAEASGDARNAEASGVLVRVRVLDGFGCPITSGVSFSAADAPQPVHWDAEGSLYSVGPVQSTNLLAIHQHWGIHEFIAKRDRINEVTFVNACKLHLTVISSGLDPVWKVSLYPEAQVESVKGVFDLPIRDNLQGPWAYEIADLGVSTYCVECYSRMSIARKTCRFDRNGDAVTLEVDMTKGSPLKRGAVTVRGHILSGVNGAPLEGQEVSYSIQYAYDVHASGRLRLDAAGAFSIELLPCPDGTRLTLAHPEFEQEIVELDTIAGEEDLGNVVLNPLSDPYDLLVTDIDGKPLPKTEVYIRRDRRRFTADVSGHVLIQRPLEGKLDVDVRVRTLDGSSYFPHMQVHFSDSDRTAALQIPSEFSGFRVAAVDGAGEMTGETIWMFLWIDGKGWRKTRDSDGVVVLLGVDPSAVTEKVLVAAFTATDAACFFGYLGEMSGDLEDKDLFLAHVQPWTVGTVSFAHNKTKEFGDVTPSWESFALLEHSSSIEGLLSLVRPLWIKSNDGRDFFIVRFPFVEAGVVRAETRDGAIARMRYRDLVEGPTDKHVEVLLRRD